MNKSHLPLSTMLVAALGISLHRPIEARSIGLLPIRASHKTDRNAYTPRVISQDELAEIKLRTEERLNKAQEKRLRRAEKRKPITL